MRATGPRQTSRRPDNDDDSTVRSRLDWRQAAEQIGQTARVAPSARSPAQINRRPSIIAQAGRASHLGESEPTSAGHRRQMRAMRRPIWVTHLLRPSGRRPRRQTAPTGRQDARSRASHHHDALIIHASGPGAPEPVELWPSGAGSGEPLKFKILKFEILEWRGLGVWRLAFGVWRLALGAWRSAQDTRHNRRRVTAGRLLTCYAPP